jgi:hypothetical protein
MFLYRNQRAAHVAIGILVIIALAVAAIALPVFFAALVIITLAAVALLLFSGISSILAGVGHKKDPIWSRGTTMLALGHQR